MMDEKEKRKGSFSFDNISNYHRFLDATFPAVTRQRFTNTSKGDYFYWEGVPIGFVDDDKTYLNNHFEITIRYVNRSKLASVVAFEVKPDRYDEKLKEKQNKNKKNILFNLLLQHQL